MTATPTPPRYVFADDEKSGATHHAELTHVLAAMLDEFTTRRLGPYVHPGARCLEIGAGAGSIAWWLAELVGPDGEVVATDTKPGGIAQHPRLTALRHNVAADPLEPLGTFDLIHARLVLGHLPNRREVLAKLAGILNPGGVLAIDEFSGAGWDRLVIDTPDPEAVRLFTEYDLSFTAVLREAGVQVGWGRHVRRAMWDIGLQHVDAEEWSKPWCGGEPGCMLPYLVSAQKRAALVGAGMTERDLDRFLELLRDRRLVIAGNLAVSTIGRRPSGDEATVHC